MKKIFLNENWHLFNERTGRLSATVPGCVHTDLKKHGIIPDYFWRDNNEQCQWIENEDWTYSCTFDCPYSNEKAVLRFDGLDTYATIKINGETVGEAHNMFIPHAFDVSDKLKEKDNVLEVHFRSPIKEVADKPPLPAVFTNERLYTRRMQCTYSWDWVDRFVTCGIFLPVYLEIGDAFRVESIYIYTQSIDSFGAQVCITTDFLNYQKTGIVTFEILSPSGETVYKHDQYVAEPNVSLCINLSDPELWWPRGYGAQPLYTLRIIINEEVYEEKFGIRTLRIAEILDKNGSKYDLLAQHYKALQKETVAEEFAWDKTEVSASFCVIVNGKRIYCRGGNWVPCAPFPSEESKEKIKNLVALAAEANMNLLRVWAGGLFEKEVFYDECDRNGILVTQDFLMACGDYPETEQWFLDELKKEAAFAAKKLRNHPCLAWWSGDNENGVIGTDMQEKYPGRTASLVGLEPQIRALDHTRTYLRTSPYGGSPYMSITRGTTHTTNFFGNMFRFFLKPDCSAYKEHFEHFMGRMTVEEPIYGTPQRCSLLRFMTEEDLQDEAEKMLRFHSKTNPGVSPTLYDYGKAFAEKGFGGFESVDDRLFKYEYMQYEWIRVVFEHCRRRIGYNDGIAFWMFNDIWPASMSWSIIDFYNLPKAAWYSFKRCAKHVIGSLKKEEGKYVLYVSSDSADIRGKAQIVCHTDDDSGIYTTEIEVNGYDIVTVALPYPENTRVAICDITFDGVKDRCFYKDGGLPLTMTKGVEIVKRTENEITLKASEYVHAVQLEGNYVFSDNYFSMLEGEEITLSYRKNFIEASDELLSLKTFTIKA